MSLAGRLAGTCALVALPFAIAETQLVSGPDTTPFRRGQWALQFGGGLSFGSLGAVRFTSPRAAWVFDVRLDGGHGASSSRTTTGTGDTTLESFTSRASASVRAGRRVYAGRGAQVVSFAVLGVIGSFVHDAGGLEGSYTIERNGWSAGAFGEVGATYLVSPRLGLGATASASATYQRSTVKDSRGGSSRGWDYRLAAPGIALVATLYF